MMTQQSADDQFLLAAQEMLLGHEASPKTQFLGAAAPLGHQLSGATPDDVGEKQQAAGEKGEADKSVGPRLVCRRARPVVEHLAALPGAAPVNLASLAKVLLSGAFSLMCTVRMDCLNDWSRVFDFSMQPDEDSVTAGAIERTKDLHFTVFQGSTPFSVRVNDFFELGWEVTMLCTVSSSGIMKVFRDGVLVGENLRGATPAPIERPHMIVGSHFQFKKQNFRGRISNVKVWDQEVSWATATEEHSTAGSGSDTASGAGSVGGDSDSCYGSEA